MLIVTLYTAGSEDPVEWEIAPDDEQSVTVELMGATGVEYFYIGPPDCGNESRL